MPQFLGKNVILTRDDPESSYAELAALLERLNVRDGLRSLGAVFAKLHASSKRVVATHGIPVSSYTIPPLALELVLASNDTADGQLDDAMLAELVQCFHCLPKPAISEQNKFEVLLRMGQAQLSYQRRDAHQLARTYRVFCEIWPKVPECACLDIEQATRASLGVGIEEALIFGFAFGGQARRGYVSPYPIAGTETHRTTRLFTQEAQLRFLKALSITYAELRSKALARSVSDELRQFRFNPLVLWPLVVPEVPPPGVKERVYLAPCQKFLVDRVTEGLVYDCRQAYGERFNQAFGMAVQTYVGDVLKEAYGGENIKGDFNYRIGKRKFRSTDWTVFAEGNAVVLEVKKSLLRPETRTSGSLDHVRRDLRETLQKAVTQLLVFRRNLRWIKEYPNKRDMEFVVVTWEDAWWANSVLISQVAGIPDDLYIHVLSVRELEGLVARCDSPHELYQALWSKRCASEEEAESDMSDWLARLPGKSRPLRSLTRVHEEFFEKWELRNANGNGCSRPEPEQ